MQPGRALTVTLLERAKNHSSSSSHDEHPLLCDNPHRIVPFLEVDVFLESSSPNLAKFSASPRLFSTHMPLHAMQENLNPSPCKIVQEEENGFVDEVLDLCSLPNLSAYLLISYDDLTKIVDFNGEWIAVFATKAFDVAPEYMDLVLMCTSTPEF
ncbi:hypothetical protein DY000_02012202 [Brassica cretica]|uniref:Sulfotransferase n=1 Tax=Brassica cretica TaxID=69181 RepID=A0ABQ7CN40_BRACR|nr:hypothetical protein DY000_02012202 [Brassica cretica]